MLLVSVVHCSVQLEHIGDFDDEIAEAFLMAAEEGTGPEAAGLDPASVKRALRRITLERSGQAVVVLCGAAYKNKGVQQLMDAVVDYLPHPLDLPAFHATDTKTGQPVERRHGPDGPLCAFAFKVARHPTRGVLVYVRVYSGVLQLGLPLVNTTQGGEKERPNKVLQLLADADREVSAIAAGHIGALVGMRTTKTGDTLCLNSDRHPVRLPGLTLPEPVFTAAIEVDTVSQEKELADALEIMLREDPSLHVTFNEDTGQTLLSGMGELHLEIALDRLKREYKLEDVRLGRMMVAYRERPRDAAFFVGTFDRELNGKRHFAKAAFRIRPRKDGGTGVRFAGDKEQPRFFTRTASLAEAEADGDKLVPMDPALGLVVQEAVAAAMGRGQTAGFPVMGAEVEWVAEESVTSPDTSPVAIRGAVAVGVAGALRASHSAILEPVMEMEAMVPNSAVGNVLGDLTGARRGRVQDVESRENGRSVIRAMVPLQAMVGYSTALRSMTGGEGQFSMEFAAYEDIADQQVVDAVVRGDA